MRMKLKEETLISQCPRNLSSQEAKEVRGQIDEWIKEGYVRPKTSEFASAIMLTRKKDDKARICADYRLNTVIIREHQKMPFIEYVIDHLKKKDIFI